MNLSGGGLARLRAACRLLLLVGLASHWVSFRGRLFVGLRSWPRSIACRGLQALPGSRTVRHELGDIVEVRCEEDGLWYQAIVEHENSDGTFTVRFDKDGYEYHYPLTAWRVPKARHFIEELEEGEMLNGRVTDISSTGFYVDVGAEDEGFVHISEIKESRVNKVSEEVRIGQEVSVRVLSAEGKLSLSMKPMSSENSGLAALQALPPSMFLRATITETTAFGAFAMVQPPGGGEAYRGLIHISRMGRTYINDVKDHVSVGQEVMVSVISTEGDRLSLQLEKGDEEDFDLDPETSLKGTVANVMSYGVFVSVPCEGKVVTGLLHVSEMADDFLAENCQERFSVGDNVTVRLRHQSKGRISWTARTHRLSDEDLEPFVGLSRKKVLLTGLIQQTCEGGAYVLVQPPEGGIMVQGVLQRQELDLKEGQELEEVLQVGQELDNLQVKSAENGRLLLTLKSPKMAPAAFQEIPEDLFLKGEVQEAMDFGVFVSVQAPSTGEEYIGLVHITQIQEGFTRMEDLKRDFKPGQEVAVRVIEVAGERLSLSMRPFTSTKTAMSTSPVSRSTNASVTPPAPAAAPAPAPVIPLKGVGEDDWLNASFKELQPYGVLMNIMDPSQNQTLVGKVHLSEMTALFGDSVEEVVKETVEKAVGYYQCNDLLVRPGVSHNPLAKVRLLNRDNLTFSMRPRPPSLDLDPTVKFNGTVLEIMNQSALVDVHFENQSSPLIGYLHQIEMSNTMPSGNMAKELVKPQQEVHLRILSMVGDKLAVTMRGPLPNSAVYAFASAGNGVLSGVIQQVTPLGLTVRLQPPGGGPACRGLVPMATLNQTHEVQAGQMRKFRVLNVSASSLLLSLDP